MSIRQHANTLNEKVEPFRNPGLLRAYPVRSVRFEVTYHKMVQQLKGRTI